VVGAAALLTVLEVLEATVVAVQVVLVPGRQDLLEHLILAAVAVAALVKAVALELFQAVPVVPVLSSSRSLIVTSVNSPVV
jgi:hypothetical protein